MPELTFYDHRGRPIKRSEITAEPQTSHITSLHSEYENHPSSGLTPGKLATILQAAERGDMLEQAQLFADIEQKDGHVFAEMGKRKRSLITLDCDIVPPKNASNAEQRATDQAREIISEMVDLPAVILDMADAIGHAYSNLELTWQRDGREWLPGIIDHRPPTWFTVSPQDRDELRLRDNTHTGQALQPFSWISHTHKAVSGFLPNSGLHRVLAWPFLFKNYSVRDLAEFLEIYGLPLRLGTYPSGATEDDKMTLLRAVTAIGHSAAGIVPEGMMIDFKEAAKGASDPYEAMINWCERTQSKAILGGTLTSQADGASSTNALGNVHNEVRHDLTEADAKLIAKTLTRDLVYPLVLFNAGGIDSLRRCPRLVIHTMQAEDLALYADAIPKLVNVGLDIKAAHVYEKLQLPAPEQGDKILTRLTSQPPAPGADALSGHAAHCPACAQAALKGQPAEATDSLADRLERDSNAAVSTLIDQVRQAVESSTSFDELQRGLLAAHADMPPDQLADIMALAFATANLTGRYEVEQGN